MTKVKIKIVDDTELRKELDMEYDFSSQEQLCKYALLLAHHILELINYPDMDNEIVYDILFSSETKGMEAELLSKIDEKLKSLDLADDLKFIINFDFEDTKCTACERERNARKNKET